MARQAISAWLNTLTAADEERLVVRINDAASAWHSDDKNWLKSLNMKAVMLSKCETPEQVAEVACCLPSGGAVLPLIETARGVLAAASIARAAQVSRLAFGSLDYMLDLDLPGPGFALDAAATLVAIASRAAHLPPPIAGVTPELDASRVQSDLAQARALGYGAKMCIHPAQVAVVREAFKPDAASLAWAQRVLTQWRQSPGSGAIQVDGKMVDKPVLLRAERILALASQTL
jgi:citrate lyase subunit beta/citryl-CoA lyase